MSQIPSHQNLHLNPRCLSLMKAISCKWAAYALLVPKCRCSVCQPLSAPRLPGGQRKVKLSSGFSPSFNRTFPWIFSPCLVTHFHGTCPNTESLRCLCLSQWVKQIMEEVRQLIININFIFLRNEHKEIISSLHPFFLYMSYFWLLNFQRPGVFLLFISSTTPENSFVMLLLLFLLYLLRP